MSEFCFETINLTQIVLYVVLFSGLTRGGSPRCVDLHEDFSLHEG